MISSIVDIVNAYLLNSLRQTTIVSVLGLGFVLGLKHATDADHIVAISTIISEKKGMKNSSLVGISWGLGHTASLLAVGLIMILLKTQIPQDVAHGMEFGVAVMLIILGGNTLWKFLRGAKFHIHQHEHGEHLHLHPHFHETSPKSSKNPEGGVNASVKHSHYWHHPVRLGKKPFLVGMIHGMAGSAALMLLVLATIPSRLLGVLYISIFGLGSIGGMLIMSLLISLPFILTSHKFERFNAVLRAVSGLLSLGIGISIAVRLYLI